MSRAKKVKERKLVFDTTLKEARAGIRFQNKEEGTFYNDGISTDDRVGEENEEIFSMDSFFKNVNTY